MTSFKRTKRDTYFGAGPADDVLAALAWRHLDLCSAHVCRACVLSPSPSPRWIHPSQTLHKTRSVSNLRTYGSFVKALVRGSLALGFFLMRTAGEGARVT